MASTPEFLGPDGVFRSRFIFSTEQSSRFFIGRIDRSTIDVQVSLNGAPFESDPDLVLFEGEVFTVPNPEVFPQGLELGAGENSVEVRTQDITGSVSASAIAVANLIQEGALGVLVDTPTGVSLERLDASVKITVVGIDDDRVSGYNFYASTSPGGGAEGFSLLNPNLISLGETSNKNTEIGTLTVDANINLDSDGRPSADPMFLKFEAKQQDKDGSVLQTDFNELLEVPEDTRKIRTTLTVNSVTSVTSFSFEHSRTARPTSAIATIPNGLFGTISEETPLYYIVQAVYFDETEQVEIGSPFSEEVQGAPLKVSARIGAFPQVTREQIVADTTLAISRTPIGKNIGLGIGSVVKDTFIDPFSGEARRLRVIADFLHKAMSFSTLLQIDDPGFTGASIPANQSVEKQAIRQAFSLVQDSDAQALIDQSFEKLASNFGVSRRSGRKSVGEVTFFTTKRPVSSINVPIGSRVSGGGSTFRTTQAAQITLENIASFYNPITKRYSVRVSVEAEVSGTGGDVGVGQVRVVNQGPAGISVINENRISGGKDLEGNRSLAVRAQGRLASVDSGTLQGLKMAAIDVTGVAEVSIVVPGDDLMQRDYDPESKKHFGGKVDAWVRGTRAADVTDSFAFSFEIGKGVIFEPFGQLSDLIFRAVDTRLSTSNPIIEMLDFVAYGFGLRNDSTGDEFDLSGVEVIAYDRIQLASAVAQPDYSLTHVIRGDFRFRTGDRYTPPRQPVLGINRLTGTVAGIVSASAYSLVERDSPMREGRSVDAGDYLLVSADSDVDIPSGTPLEVVGEQAVPIGEYIEYLGNLGVNPVTIKIFNSNRSIEYISPFDPSGDADYSIVDGGTIMPAGFVRTTNSAMPSGQAVLVDYFHDENFEVNYRTDFLATAVQQKIEGIRHLSSDILAKIASPVSVDIEGTVILNKNSSPTAADALIKTGIINFFSGSVMGGSGLYYDDISFIIRGVELVARVSLTKLVKSEGVLVIREGILTAQDSDVTRISAWSTGTVGVWIIEDGLGSATTDGGGNSSKFRGVFQNDDELILQTVEPSKLGEGVGRAFIIGSDGLVIDGYSDDGTLLGQGFNAGSEVEAERVRLTANRVLVSTGSLDSPVNYDFTVTYYVGVDFGVKPILMGPVEYLTLGAGVLFTYEEVRDG